jgi:putative transcriptional regulator
MNNRIQVLREAMGLTQEEVARRVRVTRQTINAIENNKYNPTLELAFRLARLFDSRVDDVFVYEPKEGLP